MCDVMHAWATSFLTCMKHYMLQLKVDAHVHLLATLCKYFANNLG